MAGRPLSRGTPAPRAATGPGRLRRAVSVVLEPYYYVGPGLILIALVMIVPLIVGIGYSFQNVQILNPFKTGWVGLQHYRELLRDQVFWHALGQHRLVDLRLAVDPVRARAWAWRCC